MRRPFVVSLLVHAALAAVAATVWHTQTKTPPTTTVLTVAPAQQTPIAAPPFEPPPMPRAPAFTEQAATFPEPEAIPDVPFTEAPPVHAPVVRFRRVVRLPGSLRPHRTPPPAPTPAPAPAPVTRKKAQPGPTRGPALLASDSRAPEYPRRARRLGHEGRVVLIVHVAVDGTVARVEIESSSGHRLLDAAAVHAAKTWRFRAALANGRPVAATYRRVVRFRLDA